MELHIDLPTPDHQQSQTKDKAGNKNTPKKHGEAYAVSKITLCVLHHERCMPEVGRVCTT